MGASENLDPDSTPLPAPRVPWKTTDRLTEEQVDELIARYEAGETSRELASAFAISKTAVVRLLRDNCVEIRPRGAQPD
jgi:response regulator of citrate/malate metabolism